MSLKLSCGVAICAGSWLLALLLAPPEGWAQQPDEERCAAPEYRQFDFWIGEWEVVTPSDGKKAGENRIENILGGCVLQENWTGVEGTEGKSFNVYFARDKKWHQTWVDDSGTLLQIAGTLQDGKMVLRGTVPGAQGDEVLHEISWEPLEGGQVRQHWRASKDHGESWKDIFIGIYSRKQP